MSLQSPSTRRRQGRMLRHRSGRSDGPGAAAGPGDTTDGSEMPSVAQELLAAQLRKNSGVSDLLPPDPRHPDMKKVHPLEMPAHAVRDSMLHSQSGFDDFRGLYNLGLLALAISSFRVALINIRKYGILVNPMAVVSIILKDPYSWPCSILFLSLNVFIVAGWAIEKLAIRGAPSAVVGVMHGLNIVSSLVAPAVVIVAVHPPPVFSVLVVFHSFLVCLKLYSWYDVNHHHRTRKHTAPGPKSPGGAAVQYPDNVHLRDIYYFMVAPTLCYELNFPRNAKVRKRFVAKRLAEVIFGAMLMAALAQQWVQPTVQNTFKSSDPDLIVYLERTLKLALPNNVIWLLMFYVYFHSFNNLTGELLHFGDRQFYRDWWNATTIAEFWKNWNIPVHKWFTRHVYRPMLAAGFTRIQASLAVFFISAFAHEWLVCVPLGIVRVYSFMAMMGQLPLAFLTKFMQGSQYGNVVVWLSLFIGQPMAVMLYVHDYLAACAPPTE